MMVLVWHLRCIRLVEMLDAKAESGEVGDSREALPIWHMRFLLKAGLRREEWKIYSPVYYSDQPS